MSAPATCTLSGKVYSAGAVVENVMVRVRLAGTALNKTGAEVGDGQNVTKAVTLYTDQYGAWSVALPQGLYFRIEIPYSGLDGVGSVPTTTTADLTSITLTDYDVWNNVTPEVL